MRKILCDRCMADISDRSRFSVVISVAKQAEDARIDSKYVTPRIDTSDICLKCIKALLDLYHNPTN